MSEEDLRKALLAEIRTAYERAKKDAPEAMVHDMERFQLLRAIDINWQMHLTAMDDLRDSVNLRSYGQRDPLNEYKSEAFAYFEEMMTTVRGQICQGVLRSMGDLPMMKQMAAAGARRVQLRGPAEGGISNTTVPQPDEAKASDPVITFKRTQAKVGRNDPCPCGSGKKYKACCGKN